jgi:hypothetical protein
MRRRQGRKENSKIHISKKHNRNKLTKQIKTEIIINLKEEANKKQNAGQQKMYIRITIHKSYLLLRDQQVSRGSPAVTDVHCSVNMLCSMDH